ncbi:MAG: N-acetylmuramidase domain-containing protein, partial [Pseudomonadota bacterium]
MFDPKTRAEIEAIAERLKVPPAALLAVVEVESGGRSLAKVAGRNEPLIRFEGHYFDRLLDGVSLLQAREAGLADPKAGKIKNPRSQSGRWKLLRRAIAINRTAALSSTSWGVGQVMGSHWQWLGYGSVDAMVSEARSGVAGQVELMVRYIEKAKLVEALRKGDWAHFARIYNGPAYAKNRYDANMEAAFLRYRSRAVPAAEATPIDLGAAHVEATGKLGFGMRGHAVKKLQNALSKNGYVLKVDGVFGLVTDRVVRQFQRDHLLSQTGIVGREEQKLLFSSLET